MIRPSAVRLGTVPYKESRTALIDECCSGGLFATSAFSWLIESDKCLIYKLPSREREYNISKILDHSQATAPEPMINHKA